MKIRWYFLIIIIVIFWVILCKEKNWNSKLYENNVVEILISFLINEKGIMFGMEKEIVVVNFIFIF